MAVIFMLPRALILILFCSMVVIYMLPEEKKKISSESFDFAILDGCHFYASESYCTIHQCGYPALRVKGGGSCGLEPNFNLSGCTSVGVNPFSFSFIFRLLFTLKLIFLLLGTILLTILLVLAFRIRASIFVCKILYADFFPIFYN